MLPAKLFRTSAFRLTLLYMALFGASVVVILGFIFLSTVSVIERQTDETIDAEVRGLAEQYRQQGVGRLIEVIRQRSETSRESVYLLTDPEGRTLVGNLATWPPNVQAPSSWIMIPAARISDSQSMSHTIRARTFTLSGGYRLLVGRDTQERARFQKIVVNALTWSLAAAGALGLAGGLILSSRLLNRVDRMLRASTQIMAGDLSHRLDVSGSGDEFDRLAASVNAMLDQIERLMTGMRIATDSLAHDLRGPLTRLRARIELALRQPADAGGDRDALGDVLTQAEATLTMFDSLLKIAAAEAGCNRSDFHVGDLAAVAADAVELYEPLAEEKDIALTLSARQPALIRCQPELLAQALTNLLDNAIKYTPAGGRIHVGVTRRAGTLILSVADDGPGIPLRQRDRVLERFVRLDEFRHSPGSGLGLSLVAAVAKLHDAVLTLEDNKPGLRVALQFPGSVGEEGALGLTAEERPQVPQIAHQRA